MYNFEPYNVLLAISTNIPVLLMTASVLQGHISHECLNLGKVAKTIQRFNRTGSTQNWPRNGRPKRLSARAQRHIQRLCLGNRRMSAASIAAEVEGVGGGGLSACQCSNLSAWLSSQKEASSKDDAQESLQTDC